MKTVLEVIGNNTIANELLHGFISCVDLPELYEALYSYYALELCEMPYGTMKARDHDPVNWIDRRVREDLDALADADTIVELYRME